MNPTCCRVSTGPPSWRCRRLCCIFHLSSSLTRGEIDPVAAASITAHPICSSSSEVAPADHAAVPPQPPGGDEGAGDEGQPSGGDAGLGDDTEGASCRQYSLGDIGMAQGSGEPSIHPPQGEHSSSNRQKELRDSRGIASWCVLSRTETLYFILFCDPCSPRAQMSVPVALPTLPVSLSISPPWALSQLVTKCALIRLPNCNQTCTLYLCTPAVSYAVCLAHTWPPPI